MPSRSHRSHDSVLEKQLAVLGQWPEVVGDDGLELVGDLAQLVLRGDHVVDEDTRLVTDVTRVVCPVSRMRQLIDRVAEGVDERANVRAHGRYGARRRSDAVERAE